jgi:hypothetical protein
MHVASPSMVLGTHNLHGPFISWHVLEVAQTTYQMLPSPETYSSYFVMLWDRHPETHVSGKQS